MINDSWSSLNGSLLKADQALSRIYPEHNKFFRYLAIGVISTTINLTLCFLLLNYVAIHYQVASIIGYHAGLLVSFFLNRTFTFKSRSSKPHFQLASFVSVAYAQLLVVEAVLYVLVDLIFKNNSVTYAMLATGIATIAGFIFAFILNSRLTFRIFK